MEDTKKYLYKYLPDFIYKQLFRFYGIYNSKIEWDHELLTDLVEFSNLSYNQVKEIMKSGAKLQYEYWNTSNPTTEDEVLQFYETTPYNIFSLAYWHMSKGQKGFRKKIMNYCIGDVLDYGGGIGDLSLALAQSRLNVTYGDVRGRNMEFATWLFKKRGYEQKIRIIDLVNELYLLENYDTVVCIDVIEHIPHPEVVLKRIADHLKINGRLIITQLNCEGGVPLHFKMEFDGERLLEELGLIKGCHDWLWVKRRNCNDQNTF